MVKTSLLTILIFLSGLVGYVQADPCGDSVACWLFTEGSGTSVADSSSNTNTGTFKGAGEPAWNAMAGTNAPAYADYYVLDDGGDDFINFGNDASLSLTRSFSLVNWYYKIDGNSNQLIITHQVGEFHLFLNTFEQIVLNADGVTQIGTSASSVSVNEWNHVSITVSSGTPFTLTYYINGVDLEEDDTSSDDLNGTNQDVLMQAEGGNAVRRSESGIFDSELTSTVINDIFTNGLSQAGAAALPQLITNIF